MELEAYSQPHFIAAIRGGEVMKIPSTARRFKAPKIRSIKEIYFSCDLNCHDSLPKYPPKVNRSLAMPCSLEKVDTVVKSEFIEEDNELDFGGLTLRQLKNICKSQKRSASRYVKLKNIKQEDGDLRSEVDELDLKETLGSWKHKVLKKTKARKKCISKCSSKSSTTSKLCGIDGNKSANLALLDITSKTCMPFKLKVEDEEYDLSEPQARSFDHEPAILSRESGIAYEQSCPNQDIYLTTGYQQNGVFDQVRHGQQHMSITNSICRLNQVPCTDLVDVNPQNPLIFEDLGTDETVKEETSVLLSEKALNFSGSDVRREVDMTVLRTDSTCSLNQVSYKDLDNVVPQKPLISEDLGIGETVKEENSAFLSGKPLVFNDSDVRIEVDTTDLMTCDEPLTALHEADCSSFQIDHPPYRSPIQRFPDDNASSNEDASDCHDVEFTSLCEVSMYDNRDIEVGSGNAKNFNSIVKLSNYVHSVDSMPSILKPTFVDEDKSLLVLDVTTEGVPAPPVGLKRKFQDIGHDSTSTVTIGREAKNYNAAVQDENSLPSVKNVESLHNVSSANEDNQSLVIDTSIASLTCSPDIQPHTTFDQPIGSAASEGLYENKLGQQPPERLFSARKTISPNSKEKLHRAMISAEMQDDTQTLFSGGVKATDCGEKLFVDQNAADTSLSRSTVKKARIVLTSKRLQALRTTQNGPNSRQTLKKGKVCDIKRTFNDSRVSLSSVQAARTCSTSASCYQNAIAFSQQQMVDIERLATKLLNEMHMMKEMVVDALHPESRTCSTSRSNTDKARVAVENVKKAEDATKKMLAMMTRDCIRFCKIMEISERNNAPQKSNDEYIPDSELCQNNLISERKIDEEQVSPLKTSVHKERKILFADEAGETLCHIKAL